VASNNITSRVSLTEKNWFYVTREFKNLEIPIEVTRDEFLSILADIKHILIKAKYHTIQLESKYIHHSCSILCNLFCLIT